MNTKTVLTGIQPTNDLHIGNYFGAIAPMIDLQKKSEFRVIAMIVDMHALTAQKTDFYQASLKTAATYLACGLDPEQTILLQQSAIGGHHSFISWVLSCFCPRGLLDRMVQMKDKSKHYDRTLGIYAYPVLMAADIMAYNPDVVPVGEDQKQHMELHSFLVNKINSVLGEHIFKIPAPYEHSITKKIKSLDDGTKKMSKSGNSLGCIFLDDSRESIIHKIKKAKTDSMGFPVTLEEIEQRPEIQNLINIFCLVTNTSVAEVIAQFHGTQNTVFKSALTEQVLNFVDPIREKIQYLMAREDQLKECLRKNNLIAESYAKKTVEIFQSRIFGKI